MVLTDEKLTKMLLNKDKFIKLDDHRKVDFIRNEDGEIKKLFSNLKKMIEIDETIKDIELNEFTREVNVNDDLLTDNFLSEIRLNISNKYYIDYSKDDILQAISLIASEHSFHPIKDNIHSRPWDGQKRAETLFIDYLGADDNEYTRAVARKWLAGAVARIYQPGVKFEMVPIIQGKQGIGKSTLADKLGGEFFVDSLKSLGNNKDDYQMLIGAWIIELGELSSFNDTKIETMKGFISAREDKIRLPYDKITQRFPRTCVFIGTTNPGQYLKDTTGNRRFFPIPTPNQPSKDVFSLSDEEVQQIWAEAYQLYINKEQLFLNDEEEKLANKYRDDATEEDMLLVQVKDFLDMKVPKTWNNTDLDDKKLYFKEFQITGLNENGEFESKNKPKGSYTIDRVTTKELAYMLEIPANDLRSNPKMKKIRMYFDGLDDWEYKDVKQNGETKKGYMRKK